MCVRFSIPSKIEPTHKMYGVCHYRFYNQGKNAKTGIKNQLIWKLKTIVAKQLVILFINTSIFTTDKNIQKIQTVQQQ